MDNTTPDQNNPEKPTPPQRPSRGNMLPETSVFKGRPVQSSTNQSGEAPVNPAAKVFRIGAGVVKSLIAQGAYSKVYKTWCENIEEFRVVKILLNTDQGDIKRRFEVEGKLSAKLRHPNIITIHGLGEYNKYPYIEMEYIDGGSISQIITHLGRIPDDICCSVGMGVARALSYAHTREISMLGNTYQGFIHRDLKPANVMISKDGHVKLLDFGIARPASASLHNTMADGNVIGTMQYFSPEQLDGLDLDHRTDIYSFGAVLYEMMTGAKTFPQTTMTTLVRMKSMNTFRSFTDFDFPISPFLQPIVEKCLEFDRDKRYSTAADLLKDLQNAQRQINSEDPDLLLKQFMSSPRNYAAKRQTVTIPAIPPPPQETVALPQSMPNAAPLEPDVTPPKKQVPIMLIGIIAAAVLLGVFATLLFTGAFRQKPKLTAAAAAPVIDEYKKTLQAAKDAVKDHYYTQAISIFETLRASDPSDTIVRLHLIDCYVATRQIENAQELIDIAPINDAVYYLLSGYLAHKRGETSRGIQLLDSAQYLPSLIRPQADVLQDAAYFSAMILDSSYRVNPSPENYKRDLTSWENVKQAYSTKQHHSRFAYADKRLTELLDVTPARF